MLAYLLLLGGVVYIGMLAEGCQHMNASASVEPGYNVVLRE